MPRRHNPNHSALARQKIRASHLILRLQKHIDGKLDPPLTMAQVRAIDILLRKIVPDLVQSNITGELTQRYVVEIPPLLTREEWLKKYQVTRKEAQQISSPPAEQQPMLPAPKLNGHDEA
jgi:hypothetical protein